MGVMMMSDDEGWQEYEGPRGGEGWIHLPTGEIVYHTESSGRPEWDPRERDTELEPGKSRRQIRSLQAVRKYIRERIAENVEESDENNDLPTTVSQYLSEEIIPDDWETTHHRFGDDDITHIKVVPEVDEKIERMAGQRVKKKDVVALYTLIHAVENEDFETAGEIVQTVPELCWARLGES